MVHFGVALAVSKVISLRKQRLSDFIIIEQMFYACTSPVLLIRQFSVIIFRDVIHNGNAKWWILKDTLIH